MYGYIILTKVDNITCTRTLASFFEFNIDEIKKQQLISEFSDNKFEEIEELEKIIHAIRLRERFDGTTTGPYLIKSNVRLTKDEMDAYIRSLSPEEFQKFHKEAKI